MICFNGEIEEIFYLDTPFSQCFAVTLCAIIANPLTKLLVSSEVITLNKRV